MKIRTHHSPPKRVLWGTATSAAGKLAVGMTEKGEICRIVFLRGRKAAEAVAEWRSEWPQTEFSNDADLENFTDKPILLVGTSFQHAVWRVIAKIPIGHVRTYGDIARRIGKGSAARSAGAACGANPVPFLIPCHRVVAANGLGGFSGGLELKNELLKLERKP